MKLNRAQNQGQRCFDTVTGRLTKTCSSVSQIQGRKTMILKPRIVPFCSSHRAAILGHLDCHPRHRSISQGWCTYSSTVYRRTKVLICIKSKTLHIIEGLCVLSLKQLIHARRWPSTVVASPAKLNTSLNLTPKWAPGRMWDGPFLGLMALFGFSFLVLRTAYILPPNFWK